MLSALAIQSSQAARHDALRRVDEEITQLESQVTLLRQTRPLADVGEGVFINIIPLLLARILSLKSTRNAVIPVASLHFEIIQEIFSILTGEGQPGRTALLLCKICRSWRETAIRTAELWRYIAFQNWEWVQTALSRTRGSELEFSYFLPLDDIPKYAHLMSIWAENLYRIRRFHIDGLKFRHTQQESLTLSPAWATPAPSLVELWLSRVILPPNVFSGVCPSLRSLSLSQCDFSWTGLPVQLGMTTLLISSPLSRISAHDLVTKIQSVAPTIQELSLYSVLTPTRTTIHESRQHRIALPHMTKFNLWDDNSGEVASIVEQLSFPELANIDIKVTGGSLSNQLAISRALVGARGIKPWPVVHIEVHYQEEYLGFRIMEKRKVDIGGTKRRSHTTRIGLALNHRSQDYGTTSLLQAFDVLPLGVVTSFSIPTGFFEGVNESILEYLKRRGIAQWLSFAIPVFASFIELLHQENLTLRDVTDVPIPDPEMMLDEQSVRWGLGAISFTKLQTIWVKGDEYTEDFELSKEHYEVLREWLIWRTILGVPLNSLVISRTRIPPAERDMLEGMVDEVEFIDVEDGDENSVAYTMEQSWCQH